MVKPDSADTSPIGKYLPNVAGEKKEITILTDIVKPDNESADASETDNSEKKKISIKLN